MNNNNNTSTSAAARVKMAALIEDLASLIAETTPGTPGDALTVADLDGMCQFSRVVNEAGAVFTKFGTQWVSDSEAVPASLIVDAYTLRPVGAAGMVGVPKVDASAPLTVAEMVALPVGSVVVDNEGDQVTKVSNDAWSYHPDTCPEGGGRDSAELDRYGWAPYRLHALPVAPPPGAAKADDTPDPEPPLTPAQLDALPVGSVIRSGNQMATRHDDGLWSYATDYGIWDAAECARNGDNFYPVHVPNTFCDSDDTPDPKPLTVAELVALPVGSVVKDDKGDISHKVSNRDNGWTCYPDIYPNGFFSAYEITPPVVLVSTPNPDSNRDNTPDPSGPLWDHYVNVGTAELAVLNAAKAWAATTSWPANPKDNEARRLFEAVQALTKVAGA